MEAGAGGFLQWPPIPGDCRTFLSLDPSQTTLFGLGSPPAIPSLGTPRTRPPAAGSRSPTRAAVLLRSCPRGGAPTITMRWSALRAGEEWGWEARPAQPSRVDPRLGAPTFPPPEGGRRHSPSQPSRAAAAPSGGRRGDASWARGAACLGSLSRAGGPRWNRRASRTEPRGPHPVRSPTARKHRNTLGAPPRAPKPGVESALRSSLQGSPFPPGVPLPPRPGFPPRCEKKKMPHAFTYLFILQQLQETMKLLHGAGQRALQPRCCCFQ